MYSDGDQLLFVYQNWLDSCGKLDAMVEWLVDVDSEEEVRLRPTGQLSEILGL